HVHQQIDALLHVVEGGRIQRRAAVARRVEPVLDRVADRDHGGKVEEACAALDGVEAAEHGIEGFAVRGCALERDHLLAQLVEDLAGLDQEVGADVRGHRRHGYSPSEDSRRLASSWLAAGASRPWIDGPWPWLSCSGRSASGA